MSITRPARAGFGASPTGLDRLVAKKCRRHLLQAVSSGCFFFFAAPASAASFDCKNARMPDEIAICRNATLSTLDTEMGALWFSYSRVPMAMGSNGARRDDAERFLRDRAACKADTACLTGLYRVRNTQLRHDIDGAMTSILHEQNQ
jgi:uncharacterized protein